MTDDRGRYRVMTVCTGNICPVCVRTLTRPRLAVQGRMAG